jgi:hypothetical protein
LTGLLAGCATTGPSPDEAARQAQEKQELLDGANTHVLSPGEQLGSVSP